MNPVLPLDWMRIVFIRGEKVRFSFSNVASREIATLRAPWSRYRVTGGCGVE
jgi:hypothetical protein